MQNPVRIFEDIKTLVTLAGAARKDGRHVQEEDLSVIHDALLVCAPDGTVAWAGPRTDFKSDTIPGAKAAETRSLENSTVIPGFVECHTHTVFAGQRAHEFEWRQQGQTYQEISAKGGGILSTVKETRRASVEELHASAQKRVNAFVRQGVTTLETKSGYGLDLDNEVKCLQVARRLLGPRIVSTYLGAHSRSPDHKDLQSYMDFMIQTVLPRVAQDRLADRVDIYIEKGFYDTALAEAYLTKARSFGLPITAHVEQLSDSSGAELALAFEPQSIDHLVYLNDAAITKVAQSKTTAVLLPTSDFYLKMRYPPARALIDKGARVALSTDYNPGTSPTQSLSFTGVLARVEMKMTLPEVLAAYTVGSAHALGLGQQLGSLVQGKQCDFAVLDCDFHELFYSVGNSGVRGTFRAGKSLLNP
ncbi:MAG: imidazolonepropionase [Bdellovibrionales bacterium]|nr:imidazolonepropionase [Bdellovibrionales bacterium]